MSKEQKDQLKFSALLGDSISILYLNGLLTNAERGKVEKRYREWAAKRGITVKRKPIFG